jgi:hypothetical protein
MINKLKSVIWIILGLAIIGLFIFRVTRNTLTNHTLDKGAITIKAVIINDKNYMPNQPVKPEFSYSYQFMIKGEKYVENAHDNSLQIGDSIEVEYDKDNPSINRPLHPKN